MIFVFALSLALNKTDSAEKLEECRQEATVWYMSSTALSDAIVRAALNGFPAEKVDTTVATAYAVQGHELNCIEPKLPTG